MSEMNKEKGKFYIEYNESTLTLFYCIGDVNNEEDWKYKSFEFPD